MEKWKNDTTALLSSSGVQDPDTSLLILTTYISDLPITPLARLFEYADVIAISIFISNQSENGSCKTDISVNITYF